MEVVRLLLDAGADINSQTMCCKTALMLACRAGHVRVVRALLEARASTRLQLGDAWKGV